MKVRNLIMGKLKVHTFIMGKMKVRTLIIGIGYNEGTYLHYG